jgi:SAM-dependent methyltransferase
MSSAATPWEQVRVHVSRTGFRVVAQPGGDDVWWTLTSAVVDTRIAPEMHPARSGEPSARFCGEKGRAYFLAQEQVAKNAAILNSWKFENHLGGSETVVDFGCGNGALLARLPAARRLGVEVNEPARAQAQDRGIEMFSSASDLPDTLADVVISNHALEHVLYPMTELRELLRALKPGGRLVLWLPLDDWRAQRTPRSGDKDNHLYGWTPLLLGNLLLEAGFDLKEIRVVTSAWRQGYVAASRYLPPALYRALTWATAIGLRRRQLYALAAKPR